jgi:hypothetical protein
MVCLIPSLLFWKRPGMFGAAFAAGTIASARLEAAIRPTVALRILVLSILCAS